MTARGKTIGEARRRRNSDALLGRRNKLHVNAELLDTEKYSYRWINDDGARVHDLTVNDDWELVRDREGELNDSGASTGAEVSIVAGSDDKGRAVKSTLVRKLKTYADEDYAVSQRKIDEQEAAIKAGATPGGDTSNTYVPQGKSAPMTEG